MIRINMIKNNFFIIVFSKYDLMRGNRYPLSLDGDLSQIDPLPPLACIRFFRIALYISQNIL